MTFPLKNLTKVAAKTTPTWFKFREPIADFLQETIKLNEYLIVFFLFFLSRCFSAFPTPKLHQRTYIHLIKLLYEASIISHKIVQQLISFASVIEKRKI